MQRKLTAKGRIFPTLQLLLSLQWDFSCFTNFFQQASPLLAFERVEERREVGRERERGGGGSSIVDGGGRDLESHFRCFIVEASCQCFSCVSLAAAALS